MAKILFFLIALGVLLAVLRAPRRRPPAPPSAAADMVRCARCGLFVPAAEALRDTAGRSFCSALHRDQAAAD